MQQIHKDIERVLFDKKTIDKAITRLANKLNKEYKGKNPILIGVMKGCLPFYVNLFMKLTFNPIMDFIVISSYQGVKSTGKPKIITDLGQDIKGRDVIIVEDIIDTGKTMNQLVDVLKLREPKSIKVAIFVDKPSCRKFPFKADYCCFKVPPYFIVGYGFDYDEKYRNLQYVGILKKSVYEGKGK